MNFQMLLSLLVILCTDCLTKSVKIIGGENTNVSEFPHLVSLRFYKYNKHFCGGSIISRWHILTAAHCLYNENKDINDIHIYTACTSLRSTSGPILTIDRIKIHPGFTAKKSKQSMYEHDIAVIMVKEAIDFNTCQNKIDLPTEDIRDQVGAVISGWGLISYPLEVYPDQLQKVFMLIIVNVQCSQLVPFKIIDGQMCAFNASGIGTCKGDSGGGLVVNGKIVGVASFVRLCATGQPDIYTRVYNYLEFINWIIN